MASLRYVDKVACYSNTVLLLSFISISNCFCIYVWFFYIQGGSLQFANRNMASLRYGENLNCILLYSCTLCRYHWLCRFWCLCIDLGSLRCLHPGSTGLSIVSKPSIDWAFMNAVLGGWMGGSSRDASKLAVVNMYIVCIYRASVKNFRRHILAVIHFRRP